MQRLIIDFLSRRQKAQQAAAATYAALLGKSDAEVSAGDVDKLEEVVETLALSAAEVTADAQAINNARAILQGRPDRSTIGGMRELKAAAAENLTTAQNAHESIVRQITEVQTAGQQLVSAPGTPSTATIAASGRQLAGLKSSLAHAECTVNEATGAWSDRSEELKAAERSRDENDDRLRAMLLAHPRILPALTLPEDFRR